MSNCIICNKRISKGTYFCDDCLSEEIGQPPNPPKLGLLSWLVSLPFQAQTGPLPRYGTDAEKQQWVIQRVDQIMIRFPNLPVEPVVDRVCCQAGLESPLVRKKTLLQYQSLKAKKNMRLWAPLDVVLQPALPLLILAIGMLGLFLLALSS